MKLTDRSSVILLLSLILVVSCSSGSNSDPALEDGNNSTDPATDPATDPGTDPGTDQSTDQSTDPGTGEFGRYWDPSPYDHAESELNGNSPIITTSESESSGNPIRYKRVFDRERELFGYNPRFLPGRVYFDKSNLPWIYVSNLNQLGGSDPLYPEHVSALNDNPTGRSLTSLTYNYEGYSGRYSDANPCDRCDAYIQRLTKDGKWVTLSINQLSNEFGFDQSPTRVYSNTYRLVEQVYFQNNGDVFLKAEHGVLHYRADLNKWNGYPKAYTFSYLLVGNGEKPPLLIRKNWPDLDAYYISQLVGSGDLQWKEYSIDLQLKLDLMEEGHPVSWVGNTLHIAAMSADKEVMNREEYNSAQFYVRFNLETEETDTMFMGWSGSQSQSDPDTHNFPVAVVDSKGYLHYLSGAHAHHFWHRRSLKPVTDPSWSNSNNAWEMGISANDKFTPGPELPMARFPADSPLQPNVNYIGKTDGWYTFIQYRIDSKDVIHLTTIDHSKDGTNRSYPGFMRLTYVRGTPTGDGDYRWVDRGGLVTPNWDRFSNYWHKIDMDRNDRLYVSYSYEIQNTPLNYWYNQNLRTGWLDKEACVAASTESDCVNVTELHNQRWGDEPLRPRGQNLDQPYPHDGVLIASDDGGTTWYIPTTDDFLNHSQDDNVANVVGY